MHKRNFTIILDLSFDNQELLNHIQEIDPMGRHSMRENLKELLNGRLASALHLVAAGCGESVTLRSGKELAIPHLEDGLDFTNTEIPDNIRVRVVEKNHVEH